MEGDALCYTTGEDVQLGDRVQYSGSYATVVVVSNGDSYEMAPGYEDYAGIDRGLTICDDDGQVLTVGEADERLVFFARGTP